MRDLLFAMKELTRRNGEGSEWTRAVRHRSLQAMSRELDGLGYRLQSPANIKPKHVSALMSRWRAQGLAGATVRNRLGHLRWLASKVGKPGLLPNSNKTFGLEPRTPYKGRKATPLDQERLAQIADPRIRLALRLQDLGTLQSHYAGTTWQAFFNTSVKLFFGTDDQFTGEMISTMLSNQTLAVRATNAGANVSTQMGGDNGSAGVNFSGGESVSLMAKPLLMADEVTELLSPWLPDGSRHGIVKLRTPPRPVQVRLVSYEKSETCMARKGALTNDGGKA